MPLHFSQLELNPVKKKELPQHAKKHGADKDVMEVLQGFQTKNTRVLSKLARNSPGNKAVEGMNHQESVNHQEMMSAISDFELDRQVLEDRIFHPKSV